MLGRHRRPEGAPVSDRYPKGRDRLRARSPQAIERGPKGNAPDNQWGEACSGRALVDAALPDGLREVPPTVGCISWPNG